LKDWQPDPMPEQKADPPVGFQLCVSDEGLLTGAFLSDEQVTEEKCPLSHVKGTNQQTTNSADDPDVFTQLFQHENDLNAQRKSGDTTYSVARHVLVLTALIGEAQFANQ